MGRGNYGTVWKAIDKRDRSRVAIKKINNAFANMTDALRTLREVTILKDLGNHPNLCKMSNCKIGANQRDVYLFLDLNDSDLLTIIRAGFMVDEQRCFVMWQIARGVKFLHSAKIVHRDLKPANILINQDCSVKICDFGLARVLRPVKKSENNAVTQMTDYIATRWYRPPEVVLAN